MKVSLEQVRARREKLRTLLRSDRYLSVADICEQLSVSEATARRDLAALSVEGKITRTYGGAMGDFEAHFPAFRERENRARHEKNLIASCVVRQMRAGKTYFLDAGTTILAVAKNLAIHKPGELTIVTNNLPVAELLSPVPGITTHLLGGQFFTRQAVLLGKLAIKALSFWDFNAAFLSAQAMSREGLWNSQADIVNFQRAVLKRTPKAYFCLDATKLGHTTTCHLAAWPEIPHIITDATPAQLSAAGIKPSRNQLIPAAQK